MIKQDKSLIITPATPKEQQLYPHALYSLYRNENNEIEIDIHQNNFNDKTYFLNLSNKDVDIDGIVSTRPIYIVSINNNLIETYSIVNDIDIKLEDIVKNKNKTI